MMYNEKLAIAIKTNGKVLREFGDQVYVPFGNEYSIFIKNMNTVRALVSIEIDGRDVGDGDEFVVYPGDDFEIERFLQNGNQRKGNRFKFIERSGAVEEHRGIGVEDGLVRVVFKYEKPVEWHVFSSPQWSRTFCGSSDTAFINTSSANFDGDAPQAIYTNSGGDDPVSAYHVNTQKVNDAGITVEGSISKQQFHTVASFPTESQEHVIVLRMLGQTKDNVQVKRAVTVGVRPVCTSCGRRNKATAKFCSTCGTSLQIVA